jgi:cation transport ATPase
MMETATLIICIVNIGKYLEGKAKKSILKMSE